MSDVSEVPSIESIRDEEQLEDLLSEPTRDVVETMRRLEGDLIVLGVSGKMGPTLARMARRASDSAGVRRRVLGVARFGDGSLEADLQRHGVETIRCDLLDPDQLARLPEVPNVVYMVGVKFGSTGRESRTWAVNSFLPGLVCRRFRSSRIVAFSTGNVYGYTPIQGGGSVETDPLEPVGEYAMSCLGRERILEYFSQDLRIPTALIRLNYATEMRYGVLVDLARKVIAGEAIDLTTGYFNVIWQADANAMSLRAFDHVACPPFVVNLTGPELLGVRELAETFGQLLGKPVLFSGTESPKALLSNSQKAQRLFGRPQVKADQLVRWVADWVGRGGRCLGKPTGFEISDGRF